MRKPINIVVISVIICLTGINSHAQITKNKKEDTEKCLVITGFFSNTALIKDVRVYLYANGVKIDSAITTSHKDWGFTLNRDKMYSVQIIRNGYYHRLVTINTALPEDVNPKPYFVFEFEIELMKEMKGVDDFFLDFPIAHVSYNKALEVFSFSQKYTAKIQQEVKKAQMQFKMRKSS